MPQPWWFVKIAATLTTKSMSANPALSAYVVRPGTIGKPRALPRLRRADTAIVKNTHLWTEECVPSGMKRKWSASLWQSMTARAPKTGLRAPLDSRAGKDHPLPPAAPAFTATTSTSNSPLSTQAQTRKPASSPQSYANRLKSADSSGPGKSPPTATDLSDAVPILAQLLSALLGLLLPQLGTDHPHTPTALAQILSRLLSAIPGGIERSAFFC